ncbi:MAG: DinB family protein [Vulcanimicrobiota bacterium]
MSISDFLLPEFDNEMAIARRMLEGLPEDKFTWKPHEKSMTLGRLAAHVATLPEWAVMTIEKDSLDLAPPGGPPYELPKLNTVKELLDTFDGWVKKARASIAAASDEHLFKPWQLLMGGKVLMTMPKMAVLRGMVMNHLIHHRAQLGVYRRLNNISVPATYGPSADEEMKM